MTIIKGGRSCMGCIEKGRPTKYKKNTDSEECVSWLLWIKRSICTFSKW